MNKVSSFELYNKFLTLPSVRSGNQFIFLIYNKMINNTKLIMTIKYQNSDTKHEKLITIPCYDVHCLFNQIYSQYKEY